MTSRQAWKHSLCSALLMGALFAQTAVAAPVLEIVAAPDPARLGSPLGLDVMLTGITDLYGYQLSLSFDPTLLQAIAVTEGPFPATGGSTFFDGGSIDNVLGTISFVFDTLVGPGPGVTGSGLLEHVSFSATHAGSSALTFADVLFLDSNLNGIEVLAQARDLRIIAATAVPEPETFALLAVGLAALAARRRRKSVR